MGTESRPDALGRTQRIVAHRLLLVIMTAAQAACASVRPGWTTQPPTGYRNDYFVGMGAASDQAVARRLAVKSALVQRAEQGDLRLASWRQDACEYREATAAGRGRTAVSRDCRLVEELVAAGRADDIRGLAVAEWYDERDYSAWQSWALVRVPKTTDSRNPPWRIGYVARSVLVPGWGQRTMGAHGKGVAYGVFTIGFGLAGMTAKLLREDALQQAADSRIQRERDVLVERANALRVGQWGSWGTAATLYALNIYDAMTSQPRLYVAAPAGNRWEVGVRVAIR